MCHSVSLQNNAAIFVYEINHVDGINMLEGGLMITANGKCISAPGADGERDAECAAKALEKLEARLGFAN